MPTPRAEPAARPTVPSIAADAVAAQALTSGSTGAPLPHAKRWGLLLRNAQAGAERLAEQMARPDLAGVTLVATVPPQHMYGFESTRAARVARRRRLRQRTPVLPGRHRRARWPACRGRGCW